MEARQDGSESGGKTSAMDAVVAARTRIGSGGRAVEGKYRVGSNSYGMSAAAATAEARAWVLFFFDGRTNSQTNGRTDGRID